MSATNVQKSIAIPELMTKYSIFINMINHSNDITKRIIYYTLKTILTSNQVSINITNCMYMYVYYNKPNCEIMQNIDWQIFNNTDFNTSFGTK